VEYLTERLCLPLLLKGAWTTLLLTALSMPLAVLFGLLLAWMRMSRHRWLSWPSAAYIEVIRGTPLLVQMFLIYYSLPQIGAWLDDGAVNLCALVGQESLLQADLFRGLLTWPNFAVGVFCLAANYAAYEAEILRAGLEAVDKGQREAALSIGMSERQAFHLIVLPQAFRIVVPPLINDLIAMLKDSCLVSVIAVQELLNIAVGVGRSKFNMPQMMITAAVLYLLMSLACYALGKFLERRLKVQGAHELHVDQVHGH
jgi:His/Glu/Gln/Arg/opine family amino acid ABC transporter permease subunit